MASPGFITVKARRLADGVDFAGAGQKVKCVTQACASSHVAPYLCRIAEVHTDGRHAG